MTTDRARLALLAQSEFLRRHAKAASLIAADQLTRDAAHGLLAPWCAMALRLGADLEPHVEGLAEWLAAFRETYQREALARAWAADSLCPRERAVAVLAKARDKALDDDDWAAAAPLVWLAVHFRAGPYVPPSLRAATAAAARAAAMKPAGSKAA